MLTMENPGGGPRRSSRPSKAVAPPPGGGGATSGEDADVSGEEILIDWPGEM